MNYYEHITQERERLDQIAYEYYGDASAIHGIIIANPETPVYYEYPAGVTLYIPEVSIVDTRDNEVKPPWRL